jgi:hypothetical protein
MLHYYRICGVTLPERFTHKVRNGLNMGNVVFIPELDIIQALAFVRQGEGFNFA